MLLSEYAIKWLFVISPSLASVSALPDKKSTKKFGLFMLYTENNIDFACYIFHSHQPILTIFGRK